MAFGFSLLLLFLSFTTIYALNTTLMNQHLQAGRNLLGTFSQGSGNLSKWMSNYNDSTLIQEMNIPGTHDSLTWSVDGIFSPYIRTQDLSLFDQLNNGVRFVDFRIGILQNRIRMYHASYLLDSTAQLSDILWGLYYWLDHNPTETVLVSIKVDNGNNTASLQNHVYNLITDPVVSDYWVYNTTLWTLGQARHKLIPILRLGLDANNIPNFQLPGVSVAWGWADDQATFNITYSWDGNGNANEVVYIEDLYNPNADNMEDAVEEKITALETHLDLANNMPRNGTWFIAFASGYNGYTTTPEEFALGSSVPSSVIGVNDRLLTYLQSNRGKYFGVLMFDFYGADLRWANATLGWETSSSSRVTVTIRHLSLLLLVATLCLV